MNLKYSILYFLRSRKGSPIVEETILLGLTLFAFMVVASIIFDLVEFAKSVFSQITDITNEFP